MLYCLGVYDPHRFCGSRKMKMAGEWLEKGGWPSYTPPVVQGALEVGNSGKWRDEKKTKRGRDTPSPATNKRKERERRRR